MSTMTEAKKEGTPHLSKKYVYFFGDGKAEGTRDQRTLLGGKGANLAEMTNLSIPVPPGFTISTVACKEFYALGSKWPDGLEGEIKSNLVKLEAATDTSQHCDVGGIGSDRSAGTFSMER